ncbi:Membrane protein TerC [Thermobacillus xylanilyticus]|jgi:YjbE family integral membrane protein|uniref:Membrane protein TerC n=1 Tax=Thermobacillus xylanilyticus TaxID=76633 RepID=A0ABN7RU16_THEXY|nr:TerC family protein [Thermobacillus xylanilyticus]CAG5083614.1 Membrane protein TerC [Thermobacillus xylanilyticus]
MNPLTLEFWSALITIVFIDLVLAGDNAIVIGMAARNLPKHQQKAAILWGMAGAVAIRIAATALVVYLLKVPWLQLAGGLLLVWIAYKLLVQEEGGHDVKAGNTLWQSVWTIIAADAAMGLDNVIAIAGASHGHLLLVVLGLLISIPIIIWGSTLFIRLLGRFPWIIYLGGGVLAYTAAKMITHERHIEELIGDRTWVAWIFYAVVIVGVLLAGYAVNAARARRTAWQEKSREPH